MTHLLYRSFFKSILVILFAIVTFSCDKDNDNKLPYEPDFLASYESVRTYSRQDVVTVLSESGISLPGMELFIQHDVDVIRINYHTLDVEGHAIIASGALLVPVSSTVNPVLSFQHGTIYDLSEAPSVSGSYYMDMGAFMSSTGFITVMPDYLGYGSSSQIDHPYQHRQSLATATRDMIRASYEYFKVEELTDPSDKLFLTGYSQGGYATLATLKLLQEGHAGEFNVRAATAGAGPYNKTETLKNMLSLDQEYDGIKTYMWVLDVYNTIYPVLNRPYSYYYNEPWAAMIEQQGVFAGVERNPAILFTNTFRMDVLEGADQAIMNVLADNDIFSWKPNVPLQLYHGTADSLVPYFNSQTTYNAMIESGASNIELKPVEGADHLTAFWEYIVGTFTFFIPKLAT